MKKTLVASLSLLVALSALSALAADLPLEGRDPADTGVRLVAEDQGFYGDGSFRLTLEARIGRLTASTLETEGGTFTYLNIPGYQQTGDLGAPSLPVMNRIVEVPLGGAVEVSVASRTRRSFDLRKLGYAAPLFPRQPPRVKDGSVTPFAWDRQAYRAPGLQQEALAQVQELGILRDKRLVLVKVAPVGYEPTTGAVELYNDLVVELAVRDADMAATAALKERYHSPYFSALQGQVLVPAALRNLEPTLGRPRTYAIVADAALAEPLAPFVEWKREQGFDVILATTDAVAADASAITTYVHELYENPGAGHAPPDFLLLVGDHDNLPAAEKGSGWSSHISDLDFVAVTDDYLPDILSGRLSARTTAELVPQIQKTLEYQRFEMADPSFLEHVVLTAGWDYSHAVEWGWPQIKYGMENYFNAANGIPRVSSFLSAGAHQNESEIHTAVASGAAFVNYTAHGSETSWADPSFTIADIEALGNEGRYPLVLGNCCVTSQFKRDTCFGEAWLRTAGGGAIGYIGGSNNTYWDEDLWFGVGFYAIAHPNEDGAAPAREETDEGAYDQAFGSPGANAGTVIPTGNLAVEASNTSRKLYYWEIYHLFGDPSLQVYWGMPEANPVEHEGRIVTGGEATYTVKAAPHSYVGLTLDGELLGAGFTAADGLLQLPLAQLPAEGEAKLVVTAKDRKPYFGTVEIGPEAR